MEPPVETVVSRQLNVALASPEVTGTLTAVIADLSHAGNGVNLFAKMMDRKSVPALFSSALLTPEALRSIATQLVTVPAFKETISGAVFPSVRTDITEMCARVEKTKPETRPSTRSYCVPRL